MIAVQKISHCQEAIWMQNGFAHEKAFAQKSLKCQINSPYISENSLDWKTICTREPSWKKIVLLNTYQRTYTRQILRMYWLVTPLGVTTSADSERRKILCVCVCPLNMTRVILESPLMHWLWGRPDILGSSSNIYQRFIN